MYLICELYRHEDWQRRSRDPCPLNLHPNSTVAMKQYSLIPGSANAGHLHA